LPNDREVGDTLAPAGLTPVQLSETVCWLPFTPLLLSVMVSMPVSGPAAVGVNVTLMVQESLAATPPPQLSVSPKLPVIAIELTERAAVPVLLRATL